MNGFLSLLKPPGMTSSDAVVFVRRLLPRKTPIGHGGTLDPEAAGVLPLCIGKATRLFDYILDKEKTYLLEMQLGVETDTQDATGRPVRVFGGRLPGAEAVLDALPRFTGPIVQTPPAYSAVKVGGKRAYALAREGQSADIQPRAAHIHSLDLLEEMGEGAYRMRVVCAKGTYVRTLCHDLGRHLGCGAHMRFLLRQASGLFSLENSLLLEEVRALSENGGLLGALIPMDEPISFLLRVEVGAEHLPVCKNGGPLLKEWLSRPPGEGPVRVYCAGAFAGIGQRDELGNVRFRAMLLPNEIDLEGRT